MGVAATVLPSSSRNGFSARMIALLLLLLDAILSFCSVALILLALAVKPCIVVVSSAMPKPAAANAAVTHSREIANGLRLVSFSMHHGLTYNGTLNLFNKAIKYQRMR